MAGMCGNDALHVTGGSEALQCPLAHAHAPFLAPSHRAGLQQERKRDAVVDPYRRHVYSIRRALLEADAEGLGVFTRGYCADFVRDAMRAFGIEARGSPGGGEWDLEGLLAAIQGAVNGDPSPSLADQQARFHGEACIEERMLGPVVKGGETGERHLARDCAGLGRCIATQRRARGLQVPKLHLSPPTHPKMRRTRGGWTPARACTAWPSTCSRTTWWNP